MSLWKSLNELPKEVWVITITTFINRIGTMVLPVLIFYLPDIGFTVNQAGFIFAVFGVGSFLTSPMAGRLSDRVGALQVMRFSLVLSGVILLLYNLTNNFIVIAILTLAWAIASESFRPASYAILTVVTGRRDDETARLQSKQAQVLSRLAINVGMAIGPWIATILAQYKLWKWLFIIDGLTSIAAFIYLSLSLGSRSFKGIGEAAPTLTAGAFRDRRFIFFLIAIIPVLLVFFQDHTSLPTFIRTDLGLRESAWGKLLTLNAVLVILCELPLTYLTRKLSYARLLIWGSLLVGIGYGATVFANGFLVVALTVAIWTFGEMLLLPNMVAYVGSVAPEGRQGEYMGLYSTIFSFSLSLGPWMGLIMLNSFGGIFLWSATFIMAVISAILISRLLGKVPTALSSTPQLSRMPG